MRVILLLLLLTSASAEPLITGLAPNLSGSEPFDEGFALWSPQRMDLRGWSVTDGEGTWVLPNETWVGPDETWFTGNLEAWYAHDGPSAVAYPTNLNLALANEKDELMLMDPAGRLVDEVRYGIEGWPDYGSNDLVLRRMPSASGWVDTDGGEDWMTPRAHRIGESHLDQPTWVADVQPYMSPDHTFDIIEDMLAGASERVVLHVYELRNRALVDLLLDTLEREPGLQMDILVDGQVVGRSSEHAEESAWYAYELRKAGAEIVEAQSGRYRYHHLKVLVVDNEVAVQSENWVHSGVPESPTRGNRGWGARVFSATAADWFAQWMAQDRLAWDAVAIGYERPPGSAPYKFPADVGSYSPIPLASVYSGIRVTPHVSPDHSAYPAADRILLALQSAQTRAYTMQLAVQFDEFSNVGWYAEDRYFGTFEDLTIDRRVIAAEDFGSDTRNADVLARLQRSGVATQLFEHPTLGTLHNKGWVLDDTSIVGSTNARHTSRSNNREVSILMEDAALADQYANWFLQDEKVLEGGLGAFGIPIAPMPWLIMGLLFVVSRKRS